MRRHPLFALVLLTFLIGCNGSRNPAKVDPKVAEKLDPWILSCSDPSNETPALLWNGLIGLRIGREGTGFGEPMFDIDEYQTTGEERILPVTSPLTVKVDFDPIKVTDYGQKLDMRTGVLTTHWKADGSDNKIEVVLDPTSRTIGWRWTFPKTGHTRDLKSRTLKGEQSNIRSVDGEVDQIIHIERRHSKVAEAAGLNLPDLPPSNYEMPTFEQIARASADHWTKAWETDIEIDGPVEDQQAVHSFLFYLLSGIQPKTLMAISPFGLSNEKYGGHVFWDADIWVFPALALVDPERAKTIPDYRMARAGAAERQFTDWIAKGRPTANGILGPLASTRAIRGAKFPWESSVTGNEATPAASRFEDHISGSVMWGLVQGDALALTPTREVAALRVETNSFWFCRSDQGSDNLYRIRTVMSPDENHVGDNDLYTNLLAQWGINSSSKTNDAVKFFLPHDAKSLLTYDGDPVKGYKQAAAVLAIYPLQMVDDKQAKVMMDRFTDKVTKNGPAMSDSVHALIWARLGEPDKGYGVWKDSWQSFTDHPLMLFSEKRSKEDTYFTTGAAGCLQTVLYGFLGFRIDSKKDSKAAWAKELRAGRWLSVTPNLPQKWKSVKFKNFTVLGAKFTLVATHQSVTVTPGDKQ